MTDKKLISKYFEGLCTPEEEKQVLRMLSGDDQQAFADLLQQAWVKLPEEPISEEITQRMLSSLKEKTYGQMTPAPVVRMRRQSLGWLHSWQGIAAAILVLVSIGTFVWMEGAHNHGALSATKQWKTIYNKESHSELVVLPDSSRVWLRPDGKLSYAFSAEETGERSVRLEGEAFFDVTHDPGRAFVIYTGDVATKVLGTTFNIEAYEHETSIHVSLVHGKVAVQPSVATATSVPAAVLEPGEMLEYDRQTHASRRQPIKIADPEEWTKGSLVFNEVLLKEAVQRVAARYHLDIHYDKSIDSLLSGKRLTAIFRNENATGILDNMLFISNCRTRTNGASIEIVEMK